LKVGSIFFDTDFHFSDGESGEKLFIVVGYSADSAVVAKTTSRQHCRGTSYGCQHADRFQNFYLPQKCCFLKKCTWVCLEEFYELEPLKMVKKRFSGIVTHIGDLADDHIKELQQCASESEGITFGQASIISNSLIE
jgi:hypothetical protein